MKLRLSPRAERDLDGIAAYPYAHDPQAARRVQGRLAEALRRLTEHPAVGRDIGRGLRRHAVPRLPHLSLCRINPAAEAVAVVTIRHAARRPIV